MLPGRHAAERLLGAPGPGVGARGPKASAARGVGHGGGRRRPLPARREEGAARGHRGPIP